MRILLALFLIIPFTAVLAQNDAALKKAQNHFNNQEYTVAIDAFKEAYTADPTNANVQYKMGLSYMNLKNNLPAAIAAFEIAAQNVSEAAYSIESIKEKKAPVVAYLELAKAYHLNYQFDEASLMYEKFKGFLAKDDEDNKLMDHYLAQCAYAKILIANPKFMYL